MTPAELLVLFGSYVITFTLIWLACIAEEPPHKVVPEAPGRDDRAQKHSSAGSEGQKAREGVDEPAWNVATFFGLNQTKLKI